MRDTTVTAGITRAYLPALEQTWLCTCVLAMSLSRILWKGQGGRLLLSLSSELEGRVELKQKSLSEIKLFSKLPPLFSLTTPQIPMLLKDSLRTSLDFQSQLHWGKIWPQHSSHTSCPGFNERCSCICWRFNTWAGGMGALHSLPSQSRTQHSAPQLMGSSCLPLCHPAGSTFAGVSNLCSSTYYKR